MPHSGVSSDAIWMIVLDDPASESTAWHPPVYVTQGVMMCKPIVLSSGEWALPVCTWYSENSSKMVVSTDNGKTWSDPVITTDALIFQMGKRWIDQCFVARPIEFNGDKIAPDFPEPCPPNP